MVSYPHGSRKYKNPITTTIAYKSHATLIPVLLSPDEDLDASDNSDEPRSQQPLREQDRFLPIANVSKLMKKVVPDSGKIAKDARECVQECISEFISFITSEASDRCHNERRKTINGEDILFAMSTLGFDNYVEPLKLYLQKYRETTKQEKNSLTDNNYEILFNNTTATGTASSSEGVQGGTSAQDSNKNNTGAGDLYYQEFSM